MNTRTSANCRDTTAPAVEPESSSLVGALALEPLRVVQ